MKTSGIKKTSALAVLVMLSMSLIQSASAVVGSGISPLRPVFLALGTSPVLSNTYVVNSNYVLGSNGVLPAIHFELNTGSYAQVDVYQVGGSLVKNLLTQVSPSAPLSAGASEIQWNEPTTVGTFYFKVHVQNTMNASDYQDYTSGNVYVTNAANTPRITYVYADTQTFNPVTSYTTIHWGISGNQNVYATLRIYPKNDFLNIVKSFDTANVGQGDYLTVWNGKDNDGNYAPAGTYIGELKIYTVGTTAADTGTTAQMNVVYATLPIVTAPNVNSLSITPATFNPSNSEQATISFGVDKSFDYATVRIYDSASVLRKTITTSANQNSVNWNGKYDNGSIVNGTYTVVVSATSNANGTGNLKTGSVNVNYYTSSVTPSITSLSVSPNPFNPTTQSTNIYYTLDNPGYVTVQIASPYAKTLLNNVYKTTGTQTQNWDGRDVNGNRVSDGTYVATVQVRNTNNVVTDTETVNVQVNSTGSTGTQTGTIIKNLTINPDIFNPNNQTSIAYYQVVKQANVTVQIIDSSNNVVRNLVSNVTRYPTPIPASTIYIPYYGTGNYNYSDTWNGRNDYGNILPDAVYRFKISANSTDGQTDTETAYVQVNTNNTVIGFPTNVTCAGYIDVTVNNPYCRAIQEMKNLGVFNGYNDNTFGAYQQINRAETVKVVLLALGLSTNYSGAALNFSDIYYSNAWYMPYLRSAVSYGIIQGYPDGTFRPDQTINRVELLKIFLKASGVSMPYCSTTPFVDTVNNSENRWYIDFVCFAKSYGLMHDDGTGRFNPAAPITRGDVADLFYQFSNRGFKTSTPTANNYVTPTTYNYQQPAPTYYVPPTYNYSAPAPSYPYNNYGYNYNY
ncbi:MAG: S-layer homology domain-containing protein [Candidatus Gracilibacteria bacterium]|jgi:flagellar hook assembly protein FlgD